MYVLHTVLSTPALGPWVRRRAGLNGRQWLHWAAQAERLAARLPWPSLLFAAATLITIRLVGYHFGTFDQSLLIPIFKHSVDPSLYANDPFTALMAAHVSIFWNLFIPVYRLGLLEPAVFPAFVGVTYLFFWSVWSLSQALFNNKLASTLSIAALMLPHFGLVGFSQLSFSLLNWIAVLPFTLWSLTLYLRRRYLAAFGLLGLLYSFHCLSVNFALGLLVFASLTDLRRAGSAGARNLALGLGVFALSALPVFVWRAASAPIDFSLRPEWLALLIRGGNAPLYQVFSLNPQVLVNTADFAAMVAMFFIARRLAPPAAHDGTTAPFLAGVLLVAAGEGGGSPWLPVTL